MRRNSFFPDEVEETPSLLNPIEFTQERIDELERYYINVNDRIERDTKTLSDLRGQLELHKEVLKEFINLKSLQEEAVDFIMK